MGKSIKLLLMLYCLLSFTYGRADVVIDGLTYSLDTETKEASVVKGCDGDVTIPSEIEYEENKYSVTSIGKSAFYYCSGLTSVIIPNSVTSIYDNAFSWCLGLTSVTIGNSVTSIGSSAFYKCNNLKKVNISSLEVWCKIDFFDQYSNPLFIDVSLYIDDKVVSNLEIPESITEIKKYTFRYNTSLSSVIIPNSVTSISSSAFYGCSGLSSVTIPNSVTEIGSYAFSGCSGLTSVTIPNSVTWIGASAFSSCSALTSVTFPNSETSIGDNAFRWCTALTSVTIPKSVTFIGENTFSNCSVLKEIIFEDGVEYIRFRSNNLFSNSPIENIYLGRNIDKAVFSGIKTIISLTLGNTVTSIFPSSFSGCTGLISVAIPKSVTSIGNFAFDGCKGLKELTLEDGGEELSLGYNHNWGGIYHDGLFFDCPIETLYLGRNLSYSSSNPPFSNKNTLASITIGDFTSVISKAAFSGCTGLTKVNFGTSVITIEKDVFKDCSNLKEVHTTSLESWCNINFSNNSNPLCYAHKLYLNGELVTDLITPESITEIKPHAFSGCSGLTSVTIPNSVTSIGEYAFYGCSGLKELTITNSVTSIGEDAFYGCSGLSSVTIPNSVTSIGEYAFYGCSGMISVTVGNSVTSIGRFAFSGCSALKELTLVDGEKDLFLGPGTYTNKGLFSNCPLETLYLGRNLSYDSEAPFKGNKILTTLTIGNSVNSIDKYAFYGCSGLTSVIIPNSVTSIGWYAFSGCSNIESIICDAILPPSVDVSSFDAAAYDKVTLNVPSQAVEAYKTDEVWSKFDIQGVKISATSLSFATTQWSGYEGESFTLTANIQPATVSNKELTWSSSNEDVATVSANGLVSAVKAGTATITATTDNGITATCTVTVIADPSSAIEGIESENAQVRIEGGNIIAPEGSEVFDLNGRTVVAKCLRPGIYIVRTPSRKTIKIGIKSE